MTFAGQQKLLSYQYLPITQVNLHTEDELRSLKHKSILPDTILECNSKMLQYINDSTLRLTQKNSKDHPQTLPKIDFKKWAKEVDKICGHHSKLNEIEKIQLFNNAIAKIVTSQPQLVLIMPKLHNLAPKDRKALLQKCTFE